MTNGRPHVQYVLDSGVRSETLLAVVETSDATRAVVDAVDASESAVYDALGSLERRGLVVSHDDGWQLTGRGQVVVDLLCRRNRAERLFEDTDYWRTHDASALPRQFRKRIPELVDADTIEATETSPHRVVERVADRIRESESVSIVSPIYVREYDDSMPDHENARLVVDRTLAEEAIERAESLADVRTFSETTVRVLDVDFALAVCEDCLLLSLPTLDGKYDSRSEILAESERARRWGRQLFDRCWERAQTQEEFLAEVV
ncbi:MAG: helix-turn-helix transcriptional regulator [Haloarculaceae archaeon]